MNNNFLIIRGADFSENAVDHVKIEGMIKVTLSVNDKSFGRVTGGGFYSEGDSVNIQAIPNPGYVFVEWSDGNTDKNRTITIGFQDITLEAVFSVKPYQLLADRSNLVTKQAITCAGGSFFSGVDNSTPNDTINKVILYGNPQSNLIYSIGAWNNGSIRYIMTYEWTSDDITNGYKVIELSEPINGDLGEKLIITPSYNSNTIIIYDGAESKTKDFFFVNNSGVKGYEANLTPKISYYKEIL